MKEPKLYLKPQNNSDKLHCIGLREPRSKLHRYKPSTIVISNCRQSNTCNNQNLAYLDISTA